MSAERNRFLLFAVPFLALVSACSSIPIIGTWEVDVQKTLSSVVTIPEEVKEDFSDLDEYKRKTSPKLHLLTITFKEDEREIFFDTLYVANLRYEYEDRYILWKKSKTTVHQLGNPVSSHYVVVYGKFEVLGKEGIWHLDLSHLRRNWFGLEKIFFRKQE